MLVTMGLSATAAAAEPYRGEGVVLLQPEHVLQARASSTSAVAGYIRAVESAAAAALAQEPPRPSGGYLVLAVRPGGRSMAWLDTRPALPGATAARLREAILSVPAFEAREGVVVFALRASLWGGAVAHEFPAPQAWSEAMAGHDEPMEIGGLVDRLWPDQP